MKLQEYMNDPDALVTAVLLCDFEAAKLLIKKKANINAKDEMGNTPLIMAIEEGWAGTHWVELFLENGADVNLTDDDGDSPLDLAKYRKREDIITVLLCYGATAKEGPSEKEIRDNLICDGFESANTVKRLMSEIKKISSNKANSSDR